MKVGASPFLKFWIPWPVIVRSESVSLCLVIRVGGSNKQN